MTAGQHATLARLRPTYGLDLEEALDPEAVFGRRAPLVLEIGFGMGEATAAMAAADPDRDVLAVDVHTPGVTSLLALVEAQGLRNVRVVEGDAREVLRDRLGRDALDEVRVFFPDPWPKARHHKRRLVTAGFADTVATRLRTGGLLHVATDWADYAEEVLALLTAHADYEVVSRERGARPMTRFEQRGLAAGRASYDVVAQRR